MGYAEHNENKCNMNKPYLFISYSSKDKDIVLKDVEQLRELGVNIWVDTQMRTGTNWQKEAFSAINEVDCKVIVLYVSEYSLASDNVLKELEYSRSEEIRVTHPIIDIQILPIQLIKFGEENNINNWYNTYILQTYKGEKEKLNTIYKIKKDFLHNGDIIMDNGVDEHALKYYEGLLRRLQDFGVVDKNQESSFTVEENKPIQEKTSNLISFTLYGESYELKQADFMAKVYEKVLNNNPEKLDLVVEQQQNVAYANQVPESKKVYFRPEKEIAVGQKKVWIGTAYGKPQKLVQIAKLYKILDLDPDKILKIDNENLPEVRSTVQNSSNSSESSNSVKESSGINFKLYDKEYSVANQSEFMYVIYEELLKRHPERLDDVIKRQNHVIYEDKVKAESITYFRVSKLINIAGKEVRVGASLSKADKLRHIRNLFNMLSVPYSDLKSEDILIG
ncbi:toll/interleukin-1 receptor domain-containing protein [Desulfitobacterium metallireducens]|uniref:TIR domain-containing protein n=1 Tax=Desulfitobacterium metallireducens DSM 15288 TaxID=871968 RepID=W0ED62_9FIRM|nr:toll/interleukin-1 receptor domain-containing protein [Desulfitobacterium metallireducens]AHF08677.1 hypothetical protein DESME_14190 [Desulfitobacterium metallireducens DSM 15288]